jgi:hypothetical protein
VKKLVAACALGAALSFAAPAAAVDFGANDDTGKFAEDGGAVFFRQMADAGLKQNVMTLRWLPGTTGIPDVEDLDRAVPVAIASGIKLAFAVYPYPPSAIETGRARPEDFAAWVDTLARRYPDVTTYIVGNEPNINTFWRAQGNGRGLILSGATFGRFLAAGYDALKAVSPDITVLGVGSSPRGDRAPASAGKSSPVHFLNALGDWYRRSGRQLPLMDGFSFHPYPNPSNFTVPFTYVYGWPNAGVHELGRVKQALWDAFNGTAQPTTVEGLKLYLDEVGWQVDTSRLGLYSGFENVRVTSEAAQAGIYDQLVRFVVCDPDIAHVNFFGYYDERDRGGWQSALRRLDGTERPAHARVAEAIAATGGACQGGLRSWQPRREPLALRVSFPAVRGVRAKTHRLFDFAVTANEDVTVAAGLVPAGTPETRIPSLLGKARPMVAYGNKPKSIVAVPRAGRFVLALVVTATMNPTRSALFRSPAFTVAPALGRPRDPIRFGVR